MSFKLSHEFRNPKAAASEACLRSDPVSFGYHQWTIMLYPNGQPGGKHDGWCGVYIEQKGGPIVAECTVSCLKTVNTLKHTFNSPSSCWGWPNLFRTEGLPVVLKVEVSITLFLLPADNLLRIAYETHRYSDFKISSRGRKFEVHKMVLSLHSEVFERMLQAGMQETSTNTIFISDFDDTVIERFVNLMYGVPTNIEAMSSADKLELLRMSDKYAAPYVQCAVEQELEKSLRVDNCLSLLVVAAKSSKFNLKEHTLQFIKKNIQEVMKKHDANMFDVLGGDLALEVLRCVAPTK